MCLSTRYPAAYPLHNITTKSVVKALTQFISVFGIPKVIQSDQGTNFTSNMFAEILRQLHVCSSGGASCWGGLSFSCQICRALLSSWAGFWQKLCDLYSWSSEKITTDAQRIRQRFYHVSPGKREQLESEYMLEHDIAVQVRRHHVCWWLNQNTPLGHALTSGKWTRSLKQTPFHCRAWMIV